MEQREGEKEMRPKLLRERGRRRKTSFPLLVVTTMNGGYAAL